MNFDEAPFFDVPFCRIEEAYLPTNNPWTIKPQSSSAAVVGTAANLVYQKIKKRQKYTNKLEKQLSLIELNRENKDCDVQTTSPVLIKQSYDHNFAGVADEILDAFSVFTPAMADDDSLANWDPMKISYEQKHFNSYKEQKYDDNPVEKHCPVKHLDGSKKISPTKSGEEGVRLYISNIPPSMTEEGLANLFSSIGTCYNVRKCKSTNGITTDFGFVSYHNVREAEAAIAKYNGFVFGGKYTLRVKLSVERNNNSIKKEKIIWGDSFSESSSGDRDIIGKETSKSLATPSTNIVTNPCNTLLSPSPTILTNKENPRLYISGLKVGVNENELQTIFTNIGQIYDVVIIPVKKKNQRTTYGFVTLESVDAANNAIKSLHNKTYQGNKLIVSLSDCKKDQFGMKVNKNEDENFYDSLYSDFSNDDEIDFAASLECQNLESQNGVCNKTLKHETKNMNPSCSEAFRGMMLSELSTKPFPNVNEFEVCFTEVVSPTLMYAQVLDASTIQALQQVHLLLQEFCENADLPAFTPKVQEICCAKFSDDNLWYRASILHYNADMTARVFFIDFGNKADVDSANIRCIDKKLLEYPKLASTFSLEGIESSSEDGVWSNDTVKFLTFSLVNQAIKVKSLSISDNTMICEVKLPDGSYLSEKLIAKGLAIKRCEQTKHNLEDSLKVNLQTLQDMNQNISFHHYTEKDVVAYYPTSSNIDLLITHIENPSLFYGRIADIALNESIAKVSMDLLEIYSKPINSHNYKPEGGCICAGFHSEYKEWYRVLVLAVYKDNVEAFLIDFGEIVNMCFDDLRPLPQEFVLLPSQAIGLRLFNVKPRTPLGSEENNLGIETWSESAIEMFKELVLFKKVSVEIISEIAKEKITDLNLTPAKIIFNVNLKLLDVDVGTALVSSNLAYEKEIKAVNQETKTKLIQNSLEQFSKRVMYKDLPEKELPGGNLSLLIVNTENPSLFHGQIPSVELLQELDSMSQDMTSCYSEDFSEYMPVVGEVCAAYFLAFEQFFRARIDHISKSEVTVTSIDFGNTETVTLADIKPLPLKYASIPSQAYHLSLYGVESEGKNWSKECCKFFMEYCINKKVDVIVREKLNEICYVDMFSDDVPSFSKLLIDNGYAVCKNQVCESISKCIDLSQDTTDDVVKVDNSLLKSNEFLDKRKIDPYTKLPLFDLLGRFDILVCHVESIERFYSQICDQESLKKVYELQLELNKYCQSREVSFYTPKDGELCCGYLDDAWYRVYAKKVSNSFASVFFIDYGNCCDLAFSMLRPFSDIFLTFPSLAVPMKVYNPNKVKCNAKVVEEFRNRTENKVCSVVVQNINDGLVEVEITDDSRVSVMSVLEKLDIEINSETNKLVPEMNSETNELIVEEIVTTDKTPESLKDDQKDLEGVFDISSKPKLSSPKDSPKDSHSEPRVINEVLMKNRYKPVNKSTTKNTITVSSLPLHFHPLESVSPKIELSHLAISNKAVNILMTHVESPYLSYGVALDSLHIVVSFSEKISSLAEKYKDTFHLKAGELCCVKREDGTWFRGVASSISDDEVVVFCIDHGFNLIVNHDCIRPFFDELKIYAAQAIPIKLMLVRPCKGELTWSETTLLDFKQLIGGQNVKIIAKQREGFVTSVKMRLSNQPVEQIMVDLGLAEIYTPAIEENSSSVFVKKESVPFSDIGKKIQLESLPKVEFIAIVTCSISPRLFYAQIFDEKKISKVDEIGVKLGELYDSDKKIFEFHSGQLCAVKFQDKLWYRGYIISIFADDNFVVYLVDYGYKENVPKKNIKPLPDALQQYPAQALCMQLNNLSPVGLSGTYSSEASSKFKMLTEFHLVKVQPVVSLGNLYRVVIFDYITGSNIGAQMVQLGFAEYTNNVHEHSPEKKQFVNGTLRDMRHQAISQAILASCKTKNKLF